MYFLQKTELKMVKFGPCGHIYILQTHIGGSHPVLLPRSPLFIKYIFSSFFLTLTHISEIWMISTLVCCSGTKALPIEVWPLSRQVLTRSERKREKGWSTTSAGQSTFNHSLNTLNLDCMQVHEETREDSVCWTAQQEIPQRTWGIKYWNLTF